MQHITNFMRKHDFYDHSKPQSSTSNNTIVTLTLAQVVRGEKGRNGHGWG
jgi:hypothetical protein